MHGTQILIIAVVVGIGACIQGSVGFGYGMLAGPIIAIIEPRLVPGPMLVGALALTLGVAHRERGSVVIRDIRWALAGRIPGTVVGSLAVAALPVRGLCVAFALIVLAAVVVSLAGWHASPSTRTLACAGAVSGFMGTVGSIGGPPMAMLYQRQPGRSLRGTLAGFFLVGTLMSIGGLVIVDRFGVTELLLGLMLLPPMVVGFALSRLTAPLLDRGGTRPAVLAISAASSAVLLAQQLI